MLFKDEYLQLVLYIWLPSELPLLSRASLPVPAPCQLVSICQLLGVESCEPWWGLIISIVIVHHHLTTMGHGYQGHQCRYPPKPGMGKQREFCVGFEAVVGFMCQGGTMLLCILVFRCDVENIGLSFLSLNEIHNLISILLPGI